MLEQQLLDDYDLGQYIKERVIPRAVMYFTGETLDMENEVSWTSESLHFLWQSVSLTQDSYE